MCVNIFIFLFLTCFTLYDRLQVHPHHYKWLSSIPYCTLWKKVATCSLPRWCSGEEPACQRIRHRFDPWVGKNPMDRGVWRATVHGVAKSRTRLSTQVRSPHLSRGWGDALPPWGQSGSTDRLGFSCTESASSPSCTYLFISVWGHMMYMDVYFIRWLVIQHSVNYLFKWSQCWLLGMVLGWLLCPFEISPSSFCF